MQKFGKNYHISQIIKHKMSCNIDPKYLPSDNTRQICQPPPNCNTFFWPLATLIYCINYTTDVCGKGKTLHRHIGSHGHTPDPRSLISMKTRKQGFLVVILFLLHCERVDHLHGCDLSGRQLTRVGEPTLGQRAGLTTICMVVSCLAGI